MQSQHSFADSLPLSVVMPVFNGEKYLDEAIKSVLNQTFSNFEFIIINDGSDDRSQEIILAYNDKRIRLLKNERNKGIPYCRNLGLQAAKGEFLAWCDSDDINMPTRFEKQIQFLKQHEQYGICGAWQKRFGEGKIYTGKASADPEVIKAKLIFKPFVFHGTSMWRLSKIRAYNLLFNEALPIAEDYDFYSRCSFLFPMTNLKKTLYLYRYSETSISKKYNQAGTAWLSIHKIIYQRALSKLGIKPTDADYRIHSLISSEVLFDNMKDYKESFEWLKKIKAENHREKVYNEVALNKVLGEEFLFISKKTSAFGLPVFKFYMINCFRNFEYGNLLGISRLLIRCLIKYNKF